LVEPVNLIRSWKRQDALLTLLNWEN
jgi:hypothetical protein